MLLFSDLHLSPRTLDTCFEVLRRVHTEAESRNVPVGFLGDFFDHVYNKGTLPVDILNELLRFFETEWRVPMIMIPGNHDYFDASETEHGLTPFKYANANIQVLDEPTLVNGQLWVPWRRSPSEIERILREHADVSVIFGHFDIIGFKMNKSRVSTEGVTEAVFPKDVPVYSGHYHTPQHHGNIQYLGSPYQLSLSEAEDEKSLCVLDPTSWRITETIPLDIGRRQYKWTANQLLTHASKLRPHDRVVVTEGSMATAALVGELQTKGVDITVRRTVAPVKTRLDTTTVTTPLDLLQSYGDRQKIDKSSDAWQTVVSWTQKHPEKWNKSTKGARDVRPQRMTLEGFGPFEGAVHMSLTHEGFTLVSGECESKELSNGAGKSLVTAGAWLWACTGMVDGRASLPFSDASIVNAAAGRASVTVHGQVNQMPWSVTRVLTGGPKRKHTLTFEIDAVCRTRSTISGTQRAIASEIFGLCDMAAAGLHHWLLRHSVWSQQSVTRWIDANDIQAKRELHELTQMEGWESLYVWCKLQHRDAKEAVQSGQHDLQYAQQSCSDLNDVHLELQQLTSLWHTNQEALLRTSAKEVESAEGILQRALSQVPPLDDTQDDEAALASDQNTVDALRTQCARLHGRIDNTLEKMTPPWSTRIVELSVDDLKTYESEETLPNLDGAKSAVNRAMVAHQSRKAMLQQKKNTLAEFQTAGICNACNRPFERGEGWQEHLRELKTAVEAARGHATAANKAVSDAQHTLSELQVKHAQITATQTNLELARSYLRLSDEYTKAKAALQPMEEQYRNQLQRASMRRAQRRMYDAAKAVADEAQRALEMARRNLHMVRGQTCPHQRSWETNATRLQKRMTEVDELERQVSEGRTQVEMWTTILSWTGPRGIQTHAMEYTVQKLSAATTHWLRRLYNTDDIRLEASFDEKERLKRTVQCDFKGVMSGGQWRRAQLASFMAWREMSPYTFPLLVMDEACTSMDKAGIRAVQQALREWCDEDEARTCYFITHEPEQHRDTSVYNNHTRVVQKRGRSSVVQATGSAKRMRKI